MSRRSGVILKMHRVLYYFALLSLSVAREYAAVGSVCRPKNGDGYLTIVAEGGALGCQALCDADPVRCGAFEFENHSADYKECELHEYDVVDPVATAVQGPCELEDENNYRCCYILAVLVNNTLLVPPSPPTTTTATTSATTTASTTATATLAESQPCPECRLLFKTLGGCDPTTEDLAFKSLPGECFANDCDVTRNASAALTAEALCGVNGGGSGKGSNDTERSGVEWRNDNAASSNDDDRVESAGNKTTTLVVIGVLVTFCAVVTALVLRWRERKAESAFFQKYNGLKRAIKAVESHPELEGTGANLSSWLTPLTVSESALAFAVLLGGGDIITDFNFYLGLSSTQKSSSDGKAVLGFAVFGVLLYVGTLLYMARYLYSPKHLQRKLWESIWDKSREDLTNPEGNPNRHNRRIAAALYYAKQGGDDIDKAVARMKAVGTHAYASRESSYIRLVRITGDLIFCGAGVFFQSIPQIVILKRFKNDVSTTDFALSIVFLILATLWACLILIVQLFVMVGDRLGFGDDCCDCAVTGGGRKKKKEKKDKRKEEDNEDDVILGYSNSASAGAIVETLESQPDLDDDGGQEIDYCPPCACQMPLQDLQECRAYEFRHSDENWAKYHTPAGKQRKTTMTRIIIEGNKVTYGEEIDGVKEVEGRGGDYTPSRC